MGGTKWLKSAGKIALALLVLGLVLPQVGKTAENQVPSESETYRKGMKQHDEGNYKEARRIFQAGVKKGDPYCMTWLGVFYLDGLGGLKKDAAQGIQLLTKAAELNVPMACSLLGDVYLSGKGTGMPQDQKKGLSYYKKAIDLGWWHLVIQLGEYYENGVYVERNFQTARSYYQKAKAYGFLEADEKIYNLEHNLPDVFVRVSQLLRDYNDNVVGADLKYRGKKVRITGDIISIDSTPDGGACLVLVESRENRNSLSNAVYCFFDEKHLKEIAPLFKGQTVSIQGSIVKTSTGPSAWDCWLAGVH